MKSFNQFLNEMHINSNNLQLFEQFIKDSDKKAEKTKVVILSNVSEKSYTIPAFEKELKKRGIQYRVVDINTCVLELDEKKKYDFFISDSINKKPFGICASDTAIITRRGVVRSTFTKDIITQLEFSSFFVVNSLESVLACENKYITSKILEDAGIPVPKMAIIEGEDGIESAVEKCGGKFPVILKLLSGSQGIGVSIIESLASLKSVLQTLWKMDSNAELLIQEKIESDHDLRIHVLSRRFNAPTPGESDSVILGSMRRNKINKDFRTNHSLGGTVEKTKLTPEQEAIAIESAKAIGCNWCGVDLIIDKKTGKNYVLEVNASPGTQGLKKATGIDVVKDIIDFVEDRSNWIRSKVVVGFRETITVPGIGDLVAKFDTGNGALSCSITYDEMKIDKEKNVVKWKLGGHSATSKIVGYSKPVVGNDTHERAIIELDIVFAGRTHKGVSVSLVDRTEKSTPFLVNRKFMEMIGCSVNPSKVFMASMPPKNYAVADALGDPHGGIQFEK